MKNIKLKTNNLMIKFPEISKEWHPTKNGDLKPEGFNYGSNVIVWWLCKNKHFYEAKIKDRTTKIEHTNCPECNILKRTFIRKNNV